MKASIIHAPQEISSHMHTHHTSSCQYLSVRYSFDEFFITQFNLLDEIGWHQASLIVVGGSIITIFMHVSCNCDYAAYNEIAGKKV